MFHKQPGKGLNYREIRDKFGIGASVACEKVSPVGTDVNLFRLVPVPGHGTRVPPLELGACAWARCLSTTNSCTFDANARACAWCASTTSGASARAWARECPN